MEAATKNKRGRPHKEVFKHFEALYYEWNKRPADNRYYISVATDLVNQVPGDFFITDNGHYRRNGIAEQIGRIYCDGSASKEDCIWLAEQAMKEYQQGRSVKDIEKSLREMHKMLKADAKREGSQ